MKSALKFAAWTVCLLALATQQGLADELSDLSAQAIKYSQRDDLGKLTELVPQLQSLRTAAGFQNLSLLSEELLSAARVPCSKSLESCGIVIKQAVLLSPTDPVVSIEAFQAGESLGFGERLSLLWQTLRHIQASPSLSAQAIGLGALFGLSLLTLCFGIGCLLQISQLECRGLFRKRWGQFLVPVLGFAGLPLGILPTLLCWALLIAIAKNSRRSLLYFGALALPWLTMLPICETVFRNVHRDSERQIELLLAGVNAPTSWKIAKPAGALEQLALGTAFYNEGSYAAARDFFQEAIAHSRDDQTLRVAYIHHAAAEIQLKDFGGAELSIRQAIAFGGESFELVQDLTLVAMGRADLVAQREYLGRLQLLDKKRFGGEAMELAVLTEPIPFGMFWQRYLLPPESFGDAFQSSHTYLTHLEVIEPLIRIGGVGGLAAMVGLALLSLAVPIRRFA